MSGLATLTTLTRQVVAWVIVVVLALATTAGFVSRLLTPSGAPYPLVTRDVGDHPVAAAALFVASLASYAVVLVLLQRLVGGWRDGVTSRPAAGPRTARLAALVEWVFARWYRVVLALVVVWLPFYATSFPGTPSPDGANMLTEFLRTRADFAIVPADAGAEQTPPYLDYPTAHYLLNDSDRLWSNHHPFFLMMVFGSIGSLSLSVFGSLTPGIVTISLLSAVFTLIAYGRALWLVGALVPSWRHRLVAFGVVAATPLIALWSMAIHKNQLFSAAFVWWLGLQARLVHSREPLGRRWYAETFGVSVVIAISVQFGWILLVAQALALLLVRGRRLAGVVTMGVPALLLTASIALLTGSGTVIASDPIETRGLQLQTLALILTEHPDALTPDERAQVSDALDLDTMVEVFQPWTSDPVKSTGTPARKNGTYRFETVQPEDWDHFNSVVLHAAARYPGTTLDSLVLKSYRYLDPFDEGTNWYPPWREGYVRHIGDQQVSPIPVNATAREEVRLRAESCHGAWWCRPTVSHSLKAVVLVLLLAAGIATRRRWAWLWALPVALQLGIAGVSPLSAGGRYILGLTYGLGIVLLLLMVADRPAEPVDSRISSG